MPAKTTRTAKRWLLGNELRCLRERANLTQTEASRYLETRQARITDLEKGQAVIGPGDLRMLLEGYGITDQDQIEALQELRRQNHQRGFWTTGHRRAYHEDFRLLVDLEQHADLIRTAEVEAMPGLAQCEAYVRAMFAGCDQDDSMVDDLVAARLARQEVLGKADPPQYQVVMSESCLRREFGGPEVMAAQIDHLIKISRRENVLMQVLPFKAKPVGQISIGNRFWLVRLPSVGLAGPLEIIYTDGEGDIRYLDDERAVRAHENTLARLSAGALSPAESRSFMREVAKELR